MMAAAMREPRERGIIFTGANVRAIMDSRKTQTRRLCPGEISPLADGAWRIRRRNGSEGAAADAGIFSRVLAFDLPWRVGDSLWVRETWKPHSTFADVLPREIPPSTIFYAADNAYAPSDTHWRSPIHMPRWASRLTIAVTDVRVQRLQEISCADAIAEGISPAANSATIDCDTPDPRGAYRDLWNSIYGPAARAANPWVCALTFERVDPSTPRDERVRPEIAR